jgi:exodeoxyribonuclease-1
MARPCTCTVVYNSIRFDDEVTRHSLYRNFFDPYGREWQAGNSRWDIIDLVRACRALRPEGIEWPQHEDGKPSFKLEHLTAANGISHEAAHDAMSDVTATIAMAKLIRDKQPRLFDYALKLRSKREVAKLLDVRSQTPVLHTSAMFAAERFCTSLVMPLAQHPSNNNGVISYDLAVDPTPLIEGSVEEIQQRLYTPAAQLPAGVERIPLKTIHINRCPIVATAKLLNDAVAERIGLDVEAARRHYQMLKQATGLAEKLAQVFASPDYAKPTDPDCMLYSGGFFSSHDRALMDQVRASSPEQLAQQSFPFEDARLPEMLFRYRARNYPQSLSVEEQAQWSEFCFQRLTEPSAGGSLTLDQYHQRIEELMLAPTTSDSQRDLLGQLIEYGDELLV